jgi:hypothetical protein
MVRRTTGRHEIASAAGANCTGCDANELVPLFADKLYIYRGAKECVEAAVLHVAVQPIELLIGRVAQPWHERVPQQIGHVARR